MAIRWPDGVVRCPHCGSENVTYLENARRWKCYEKHPQAAVLAEGRDHLRGFAIGLEKWLPALWLLTNCKNGISSYELARALGVTQKTAWFMLSRLRLALQAEARRQARAAKSKWTKPSSAARRATCTRPSASASASRSAARWSARSPSWACWSATARTAARSALEVITNRKKHQLEQTVVASTSKPARPSTPMRSAPTTGWLQRDYIHNVIDHAEAYVDGQVHTNGLENFWSLLKRAIKGTYVSVEPFHLFRYLDEQAFRFNKRKGN